MMTFAGSQQVIEVIYLLASALFIFSLKWMSSPATARRGVWAGEIGMVLAIAGTLLHHGIVDYKWIAVALVPGGGYRRSARAGANDCCPAAYGAESCFWRTLRHAGGNSRVLFANARRAALHDGGSLHGGDPRLTDVYWQPDGGGQTARGLAAAPAHLSRTKLRQSVTAGDFYRAGSVSRVTSRRQTAVSGDDRHPTTIRHSHGGPNRWRRYADRHFSA